MAAIKKYSQIIFYNILLHILLSILIFFIHKFQCLSPLSGYAPGCILAARRGDSRLLCRQVTNATSFTRSVPETPAELKETASRELQ